MDNSSRSLIGFNVSSLNSFLHVYHPVTFVEYCRQGHVAPLDEFERKVLKQQFAVLFRIPNREIRML